MGGWSKEEKKILGSNYENTGNGNGKRRKGKGKPKTKPKKRKVSFF